MLLLVVLLLSSHLGAESYGIIDGVKGTTRTLWQTQNRPSMALDGDTTTYYHSGNDPYPEWLKLTLPTPVAVVKVEIVNRCVAARVIFIKKRVWTSQGMVMLISYVALFYGLTK